MKRVLLSVEGQTEETFIRELLRPKFHALGIDLSAIIVGTSRGHKGGISNYHKVKPQITRLCRGDQGATVTTMFDLYALPTNFPGFGTGDYQNISNGHLKADYLEQKLAEDINEPNFIPNLSVHEFEAYLFADAEKFKPWLRGDLDFQTLSKIANNVSSPEDINDGPQSAPSKRVLKIMPNFRKTLHGISIAKEIGVDSIRAVCPHFDQWLKKIEALRTI